MSLQGLRVAVTGSRRANELAQLISNNGGIPYVAPTIGIGTRDSAESEAQDLINEVIKGKPDYTVFMTGPGVYAVMQIAERFGLKDDFIRSLAKTKVVARSPKPRGALSKHGVNVEIMPVSTHDNTAEGVARELMRDNLEGKHIVIVWHGSQSVRLGRDLRRAGAGVSEFRIYDYSTHLSSQGAEILKTMGYQSIPPEEARVLKLIEDVLANFIDVITFTSPPSVRNLFSIAQKHSLEKKLVEALNTGQIVVAIGQPTKEEIESQGVRVDVIPDIYKLGAMVAALGNHVSSGQSKKTKALR